MREWFRMRNRHVLSWRGSGSLRRRSGSLNWGRGVLSRGCGSLSSVSLNWGSTAPCALRRGSSSLIRWFWLQGGSPLLGWGPGPRERIPAQNGDNTFFIGKQRFYTVWEMVLYLLGREIVFPLGRCFLTLGSGKGSDHLTVYRGIDR